MSNRVSHIHQFVFSPWLQFLQVLISILDLSVHHHTDIQLPREEWLDLTEADFHHLLCVCPLQSRIFLLSVPESVVPTLCVGFFPSPNGASRSIFGMLLFHYQRVYDSMRNELDVWIWDPGINDCAYGVWMMEIQLHHRFGSGMGQFLLGNFKWTSTMLFGSESSEYWRFGHALSRFRIKDSRPTSTIYTEIDVEKKKRINVKIREESLSWRDRCIQVFSLKLLIFPPPDLKRSSLLLYGLGFRYHLPLYAWMEQDGCTRKEMTGMRMINADFVRKIILWDYSEDMLKSMISTKTLMRTNWHQIVVFSRLVPGVMGFTNAIRQQPNDRERQKNRIGERWYSKKYYKSTYLLVSKALCLTRTHRETYFFVLFSAYGTHSCLCNNLRSVVLYDLNIVIPI